MKEIVVTLGIVVTLFLGLWNLIINYRNSRRTSFINTVTSERIKWIDKLRRSEERRVGKECKARL